MMCGVQECLVRVKQFLEEEKKDVRFVNLSPGDVREGGRERGREGGRERGRDERGRIGGGEGEERGSEGGRGVGECGE